MLCGCVGLVGMCDSDGVGLCLVMSYFLGGRVSGIVNCVGVLRGLFLCCRVLCCGLCLMLYLFL